VWERKNGRGKETSHQVEEDWENRKPDKSMRKESKKSQRKLELKRSLKKEKENRLELSKEMRNTRTERKPQWRKQGTGKPTEATAVHGRGIRRWRGSV
jgi:hypothetical protein